MKNSNSQATAVALEVLQARVGHRLAARLSEHAETLDADVTERLRFAREQALERARAARAAAEPVVVVAAGPSAAVLGNGNGAGWWVKLGALLPLAALAGGLMLIQHLHTQAQIAAAAAIDAELLTDDLPPAAYTDPGFAEFLKAPRD